MDKGGATDLRESVLHLVQVTVDPQLMAPRVIGDHPDAAGAQGVVDILDIGLDLLGGFLDQLGLCFLLMI